MADLTVVAQDPCFGGGARALEEAFVEAVRRLGRSPQVHWVQHPTLRPAQPSRLLDRVEAVRLARGSRRLVPLLRDAGACWVVAALATHGYAAPRAGVRYGCWIATSLEDENRGRLPGLRRSRRLAVHVNEPALRRFERAVLRGATRVYGISPASRNGLAHAAGLDPRTVGILPVPVDLDAFSPLPDNEWLASLERPTVVFVGRADDPRKNVDLLLRAFPLLRARVPDVRLLLVGTPPRASLPSGAEAVGEVRRVAPTLRGCALLVLPSLQEGFGIVAAEALACGVPVLTTPSGGPEELVRSSGGGLVLGGFDAEELAAAAADLLQDTAILVGLRRAGRAHVVREHSPELFRALLATALADVGE